MPRTHHAVRTWRLSCGCLRDYPGMPLGRAHRVLCVTCRIAVITLHAYPEPRCGAKATVAVPAGRVRVSCTQPPGSADCDAGVHHDKMTGTWFEASGALRAGRQGQTGRA
jgi:hypothetical protein